MLVTNQLQNSPSGGRELLSKLNHDVLLVNFCERLVLFDLPKSINTGLASNFKALIGHIDGLNKETISRVLHTIQLENVDKVFVDGSNLGLIVKVIKQRLPHVEVSTFFHNVESRFFLGALRQAKTLRAFAVMMANYLAECYAVRYSDRVICMSERDSNLLHKVYGRAATHLSPMALQDKLNDHHTPGYTVTREKFILFVGGGFYANREGIKWFVKHVVPRISIKTCIVGRGLEDLRIQLEREGKVEVIGAVESLAQWYRDAHLVIAPVFDGSGMKTKVAEALMFGKKIIGTPEAFSGYEHIVEHAGWLCITADDFVSAIERAQKMVLKPHDPELRTIYEKTYSFDAMRSRYVKILGSEI